MEQQVQKRTSAHADGSADNGSRRRRLPGGAGARVVLGVSIIAALVAMMAGPANALVVSTSGTSTNISSWTIGGTDRHQTASGQDIRIDLTSGPGIDARWYKCTDYGVAGTRTNIYVSSGWRIVGTDFAADTCFNVGWRGADVVGTWNGQLQYQANVA